MDRLGATERMAAHYLRYALLRSAKHTNIKSDAEAMAAFTLLAAGSIAGKLGMGGELALLIECVAEAVGWGADPADYLTCQQQLPKGSDQLLPDERMRKLAAAINMLGTSARQVLLLYHIELMSTKQVAEILSKSILQIRSDIAEAERGLLQCLAGLCSGGPFFSAADVCLWLTELGDLLDDAFEQVAMDPPVGRLLADKHFRCSPESLPYWNPN